MFEINHVQAQCSLSSEDATANAEREDKAQHALKTVTCKWLKVIYAIMRDAVPYATAAGRRRKARKKEEVTNVIIPHAENRKTP